MMDIATFLAERAPMPDAFIRFGMRSFIARIEREADVLAAGFVVRMDSSGASLRKALLQL
jgi:hypothetical protein